MGYYPRAAVPAEVSGYVALGGDTTASTSAEQWGTKELVFSQSWFTGPVTIEADLTGYVSDVDPNEFASINVQISTDGGSSWNSGPTIAVSRAAAAYAANTDDRHAFSARAIRANVTLTGDVQVRALITTPGGAGVVSFDAGYIMASVRPANPNDSHTSP